MSGATALGLAKFNDVANTGYSTAGSASSRNVMMVWDPYQAPAPSDNFYENTDYGTAYGGSVVPDPIYGEQHTFTQSLIDGNTRTESLMETMHPDRDYAPPKIDAKSMMRDANKVVTDGEKVSRQANLGMEQTKEQIASFQQDWKSAKTEALDKFMDTAQEMGLNPLEAADQMLPSGSAGKEAALAYIAVELWAGGGSFATAGKTYYLNQELSKADQKLSPDDQRKLLEDTLKQLQQSNQPQDTRLQASTAGGGSPDADAAPDSEVQWQNFEIDDLAEFLGADPDGMDQPEMQELLQVEHELEMVLDNHEYVQEHYADVVTADKMFASVASGNEKMTEIVMDAEVVQAKPVVAESPKYDSLDAMLAGDSVRGVTLLASDTRFDSKAVETVLDLTKVDTPEVKRQLTADIEQQFQAGMKV